MQQHKERVGVSKLKTEGNKLTNRITTLEELQRGGREEEVIVLAKKMEGMGWQKGLKCYI